MKRIILALLSIVMVILSVSCTEPETQKSHTDSDISLNEQTVAQLGVYEPTENIRSDEDPPLNFEKQAGMWFTYMDYLDILRGKSEKEFTESVSERFENAKEMGINTLYVHVRAFNDSYYKSGIFPKGEYYDGDYDPLEIMVNTAHGLGLSVHAWLNPLRCQTDEQLKALDDSYLIKKWYNDKEKNGTYIVKTGDYWYLNPAYSEVLSYISDGIREIAENYSVDGFHIDDYFYPTTGETFDAAAFSQSAGSDLSSWRTENISRMVKTIYDTVKAENPDMLFGISPQGNMDSNYTDQYADVKAWASQSGYCDYIVPQIYFGFENESCPFEKTADSWQSLNICEEVKLVIGICTYKIGNEDKWAGSGIDEWKEKSDIVSRQAEYCAQNGLGIAVYSYDSTFSDTIKDERTKLSETIKSNYGGEQQ
ncbi:MAG: family 10 glycosylhydrolase [Oscillospiraceae bacterium]|nr:family 10 glycosylhydrolase [Oscillospiraceae bacterium]